MGILQDLPKFRARYGSVTELTEVIKMIYPYPGYLWHWRTELAEVPGTGMNVVQNLQKFRLRV